MSGDDALGRDPDGVLPARLRRLGGAHMMWKRLHRAFARGWIRHGPSDVAVESDDVDVLKRFLAGEIPWSPRLEKMQRQCDRRAKKIRERVHRKFGVALKRSAKIELNAAVTCEDCTEAVATLEAMAECDLLHLPYRECYFETAINDDGPTESVGDDDDFTRVGILADETDGVIECYAFAHPPGHHEWIFSGSRLRLDVSDATWTVDRVFAYDPTCGVPQGSLDTVPQLIVATALTLLHTPGASIETDGRVGLVTRDRPEDAVTVVRVHAPSDAHGDGARPSERKRVRLHLRRGHHRTQRYGPRRSRSRTVWIRPTLVGYREEGVIRHSYEVTP